MEIFISKSFGQQAVKTPLNIAPTLVSHLIRRGLESRGSQFLNDAIFQRGKVEAVVFV